MKPPRYPQRKVHLCYSARDREGVEAFLDRWVKKQELFLPTTHHGPWPEDFTTEGDVEAALRRIRSERLEDSTVTLVLLGTCTHTLREVDWELKASLMSGDSGPNGLLGILLPGKAEQPPLPQRLQMNRESGYARLHPAPELPRQLRHMLDGAHHARSVHAGAIRNLPAPMAHDIRCRVHGIAH